MRNFIDRVLLQARSGDSKRVVEMLRTFLDDRQTLDEPQTLNVEKSATAIHETLRFPGLNSMSSPIEAQWRVQGNGQERLWANAKLNVSADIAGSNAVYAVRNKIVHRFPSSPR